MKMPCLVIYAFIVAFFTVSQGVGQTNLPDSTRLPGDYFSLGGALEMFRKAGSPEEFEMLINAENSHVNNLDLNDDGAVDYIRVINKKAEAVNLFILQAVISETERQDIAVIELEKTDTDKAILQIVGDEDIFGEEVIVEPVDETIVENTKVVGSETDAIHGPAVAMESPMFEQHGIIVNVWSWPLVRFIYAPGYAGWISRWSWNSRPVWFRPWRPLGYMAYRPLRHRYNRVYVVTPARRIVHARIIYRPARVVSATLSNRNRVAINSYRTTRVTQSTTSGRGITKVKATKKTTTIQGPRGGKVSRTRTTVRRKRQ